MLSIALRPQQFVYFWTHTQREIDARQSNAGNWSPNHFVPLLLPSDNSQSQNHIAQPKISGSGSTPTKATTKNNTLTQVRIPEFNADDNETQPFQVSSTVTTATNEITTPRTKRRLQLAETYANVQSTTAEYKRMQARERMATKRAETTPEQAERQRMLARERSAARRAVLTPQQAERERTLARERSAARRAALTSDEVEQQRALTREKNAARRAALTSDEVEQQRALTREKNTARRAALTSEEVEQQRSIDREIHAARRATLTPKEVEQQRTLARERSMAKRATATPIEAEEQRVLARERSAARRAARMSEEAEQQQTVAYKTTRLQKTVKRKQTIMKRKPNECAKVDWPKPVDIDCKINCLKNFIQHMSMDSLAESVCGICNVRRYKRDLRHVPLSKVPSIELLKIHPDLHNIIPKIQEINSFNSNDSNVQSSTNNQPFTCINGMLFYEAGLRKTVDRKKRSLIHCDVCTECWSSLAKEKIPKFSATNKVWMGDIPKQLQGLTIPEQRLIALYRHNSCIVKLQSPFHSTSTAQSALKGNCISFPQDVINIATTLPLDLDDLCDSLKIIFVGSRMPQRSQLKHILTVRKKKIYDALQWLNQNNPLYRYITINQSTIDKLPDDDVPECLWATMEISNNTEAAESERSSYIPDPLTNASESNTATTVPITASAVLDVNGTTVSADDVAEHLLGQMKIRVSDKTLERQSEEAAEQDPVYMIPRGNKPVNEYSNPNLLLGVFPTLFPYGCGALEDSSRPVQINFREHVRYLLSYGDRRFEEHHSFIFVLFNILQRRTACFHAQLMTSRSYFQKSAQLLESLSSEDVAIALLNISKASYSKVTDERINALMKHIKVVGGHVMGSAHSRSALRMKIHSLCFNLGLPSLFVTINPADIHSPVALYFAGVDLDLDRVLPELLRTSYERAQIIATHPVATAKFFNCLIKSILKCLVLGGALGPTKAYFGTVESQGRGSLHLHLLIWLNHEYTPAQLKENIQNQDFRDNLLKYLEDVVKEDLDLFRDEINDGTSTTSDTRVSIQETGPITDEVVPACLPTPNPASGDFHRIFCKDVVRLVETSNIHKHSATCYKYSKGKSDTSKTCRMRMPRVLVKTSNIDLSTGQITMRRSHPWINNFNEWLISACRSNMDIKFIWSGNDAKALVYYITDYVTKSTLAFHDMFALAQQGVKSIEQQRATNNIDNAIEKSRKLVLRCYNMIASQQEVSGVQVASYLMNYDDHYTTHTFRNLFLISIENYLQAELTKARLQEKDIDEERLEEMTTPIDEEQEEDTKQTEEQFLLEPTQTKNGDRFVMVNTRLDYQHRSKDLTTLCLYDFVSRFYKKTIDKSDRRLIKNANGSEGEQLYTEGTKMNERHTFETAHPQSSSHIIIKHTKPVVPVLIGPQIPRQEREETRERYSRALLTLFVPWRSVHDLCALNQTWTEALELQKPLISPTSLKIIENIQLLHECKHDRDEHLRQVLVEAQSDNSIDPVLIPNYYEDDQNTEEDDPEQLLQMLSIVNENTTNAYSASIGNPEQRYLNDALQAIDNTDRFALLNDQRNVWNQNSDDIVHDSSTFVVAHSHHAAMMKEWKRDIENRKDKARNYLISGENTVEIRDDEVQIEVVAAEIPTSPFKAQTTAVLPVTITTAISFPTKMDIIKEFTLNSQQKYAFMIVTSHLDGENQIHTGIIDNQLLMCVPGCGGTGKSQLIRAITQYFQLTKRGKMLRKLAPTSIAAAEIDGLTIHSFLGEGRKNAKKKQTRTFRPGDTKLENEWRHVKYLIIDEMSMVGLSLLARLNRIVKTAKHINSEVPFGGVNAIFFGDYLQYSPVLDRPLYHSCASSEQITERQIDMQCAHKLISQMNCVVELSQQMRTEDVRYLELLNRLRSGQSTIEDYQLLCTRIIGNPKLLTSLKQKPWNEAPILVFRNTLRTQINNRAVLNKAMEMGLRPMVCVAQDYFQGKIIEDLRLRKTILELPDNKTEHLPGYLPLVPGMPVLLTENVATELGLSNGTRGIFHQLVYEEPSADIQFQDKNFPANTKFITQLKYALVEFPNCKLDSELAELQTKIIPISISEQTFLFDIKELLVDNVAKAAKINKKTTKISVKRKALPLIPAYSMTTHKSQGQTLSKIIIDLVMPPGPVEVASVYVPLSRVKRLDDLLIVRSFDFAALQVKPSTAQCEELKRLDRIAKSTTKRFPLTI
ncbi:unnamed protein product [Rotaria magnacalcarata]|uniref:ATP-dependent DNA helicase n=1 Tax=Rotaria magnacalcarata TaxID=392030 RepID=A0A816XU15_9BILA|nr:unnamed protein product [Rotaria magnacalcarata]